MAIEKIEKAPDKIKEFKARLLKLEKEYNVKIESVIYEVGTIIVDLEDDKAYDND